MRLNEDYINDLNHDEIVKKHNLIQEDIDATIDHLLNDEYNEEMDVNLQNFVAIYKPRNDKEFTKLVTRTIEEFGYECNLNWIDTSEVTSMNYIFEDSNFNGNISEWNTSKVTSMYNMFCACNFNGDISKWDVSKVVDMSEMFEASDFKGDISSWEINDACDISDIFKNCRIKLCNIPKCLLKYYDAKDIIKW